MDGAAAEVGDASGDRVLATPPLIEVMLGEAVAVLVVPLGEAKRVGEVEAVAQQGDLIKATPTSTKSLTPGEMAVHPSDPSSTSPRTFPLCTLNVKRLDTRSMRRGVAAPR